MKTDTYERSYDSGVTKRRADLNYLMSQIENERANDHAPPPPPPAPITDTIPSFYVTSVIQTPSVSRPPPTPAPRPLDRILQQPVPAPTPLELQRENRREINERRAARAALLYQRPGIAPVPSVVVGDDGFDEVLRSLERRRARRI